MYDFYPLWKKQFTGAVILAALIIFVTVMLVTLGAKDNPLTAKETLTAGGLTSGLLMGVTAARTLARYLVRRTIIHAQSVILRDGFATHIVFRYGRSLSHRLLRFWDAMPAEGAVRPMLSESEKLLGVPAPRVSLNNLDPYIFVTFRRQGDAKGWDERAQLLLCVAGLKRWQWCEVEWLDDQAANTRSRVRKLLRHEFEHTMIARSYPTWDGAMQHRVMEFSRREDPPQGPA